MRRYAPFLFTILFSALLLAAPERFDTPQSQLWLIAKTFLKLAVIAALVVGIIIWYKKNKP
ncbi:MAG TPA: hypothetical protein PLV42_11785 [bacterium]|nr:hypothetical protein [bacterium]